MNLGQSVYQELLVYRAIYSKLHSAYSGLLAIIHDVRRNNGWMSNKEV